MVVQRSGIGVDAVMSGLASVFEVDRVVVAVATERLNFVDRAVRGVIIMMLVAAVLVLFDFECIGLAILLQTPIAPNTAELVDAKYEEHEDNTDG